MDGRVDTPKADAPSVSPAPALPCGAPGTQPPAAPANTTPEQLDAWRRVFGVCTTPEARRVGVALASFGG